MKKKIIICIAIFILLILLIPIPMRFKDGGSVEYKAILYKVTKVKRLTIQPSEKEFDKGLIIEIFGIEIYNSLKKEN